MNASCYFSERQINNLYKVAQVNLQRGWCLMRFSASKLKGSCPKPYPWSTGATFKWHHQHKGE
jgi:hypothetical protein